MKKKSIHVLLVHAKVCCIACTCDLLASLVEVHLIKIFCFCSSVASDIVCMLCLMSVKTFFCLSYFATRRPMLIVYQHRPARLLMCETLYSEYVLH